MDELKEIFTAISRVPIVNVRYTIDPVDQTNEVQEGGIYNNIDFDLEPLIEGGEGMMKVHLKRVNKSKSQRVSISHFPKPKDANWILIVGNPSKNDVLGIKRIQFNWQTSKTLNVQLPDDFLNEKLSLFLMCDSYIGLDQEYSIDLL